MTRKLRIPAALAVVVLGSCGGQRAKTDAAISDGKLADAAKCLHDAPPADGGCVQPCGDISGGTGLCHGMEVCVDPCGFCPPGCEPLV